MMLKKITYFVVALHLSVLLFAATVAKQKPSNQPIPIAVKTYTIPRHSPPIFQQVTQTKAQANTPTRKKAGDVMSEVQKNIVKIEKKKDNKQKAPQPIKKASKQQMTQSAEKTPQIDQKPKVKPEYPLLLVQKLKSVLHLPEEGDVKIEVTLKNSGEVIEVKVLSSKSTDNAAYLESNIPKMRFPMFTAELSGKKQHTFTLTFCHDD